MRCKDTFHRYIDSINDIDSKEKYMRLVDLVNQVASRMFLKEEEIEALNKLLNKIATAYGYIGED